MMSTSFSASCLRIANISSCLRIVLAFSISCSSANARSSGGDLDFRSCSFISRMRVVLRGVSAGALKTNGAGGGIRKEGRRSWVSAGILRGLTPMRRWSNTPDRDSTASAYVRWDAVNIRKNTRICKSGPQRRLAAAGTSPVLVKGSERLHHREDHDNDHEGGGYLVENPKEFRGFP